MKRERDDEKFAAQQWRKLLSVGEGGGKSY